jgi:hypothetical protein
MYSKIENKERLAKRKQIAVIAQLLQIDENTLVTLWVANKIIADIGEKKGLARRHEDYKRKNINKLKDKNR